MSSSGGVPGENKTEVSYLFDSCEGLISIET